MAGVDSTGGVASGVAVDSAPGTLFVSLAGGVASGPVALGVELSAEVTVVPASAGGVAV